MSGSSSTNHVKGVFIAVEPGQGFDVLRCAIVEATPRGTLIVRGETDGALRVILSQLTEADLDAIMDGVSPAREIA